MKIKYLLLLIISFVAISFPAFAEVKVTKSDINKLLKREEDNNSDAMLLLYAMKLVNIDVPFIQGEYSASTYRLKKAISLGNKDAKTLSKYLYTVGKINKKYAEIYINKNLNDVVKGKPAPFDLLHLVLSLFPKKSHPQVRVAFNQFASN